MRDLPKYSISLDSYKRFREFINFPQFEILFANYKLQYSDYCFIKENLPKNIQESKLFTESDHEYLDMPWLLKRVILHIQRGEKRVESLAEVGEDTIRHFKRVRLYYDDQSRKEVIMDKIREMSVVPEIISDDDLLDMYDNKVITRAELNRRMKENVVRKEYEEQDGIVMRPVARHYYLPLMYSKPVSYTHLTLPTN